MSAKLVEQAIERLGILVVDENAYLRKLTRAMLTGIGAKTVYEAADGLSALDIARNVSPDVVLLDWNLPVRAFGVTVVPGDYILADDDGAVAIPAHLAQEIADVCSEQEHKEEFIRGLVQQGVPVSECYPPNAATLAKYEAWKKSR